MASVEKLVKISKRILTTINAYPMTEHNLAVRAELVNVHILIDDLINHYNNGRKLQMTQLIKPNDLVYIPSEVKKVYKVEPDGDGLIVDDGYFRYHINAQGQRFYTEEASWGIQPFAFLATPENKEKLELVYGKLEDIPVDEELEKFSKALDEISYFYANLYLSDGNVNPSKNRDELKPIKDKLIEMFKERGEK